MVRFRVLRLWLGVRVRAWVFKVMVRDIRVSIIRVGVRVRFSVRVRVRVIRVRFRVRVLG